VNALQQAFPQATVELWATDQHRVGLKPILRRVWVRKGSRPRVAVQHRFQWLYLSSFVQPASGQTEWLLLPTVRVDVFTLALAHFAQAVGAGPAKRILLVRGLCRLADQQRARRPRRHPPALLAVPCTRIAADVERLWPLSNEGVANQSFRTLDELEAAQIQRCVVLQNHPEVIRAHTHFHWWPPSSSKHQ
jgi:hypothetical protein